MEPRLVPTGRPLKGHAKPVLWGSWTRIEGRPVLATGGMDEAIWLWDPIARAPLGSPLTGHRDWVPWGEWGQVEGRPVLATASWDGTVRLWDSTARASLGPPLGPQRSDRERWGAWGKLGGRPVLATGGDDGTVRLWDPIARALLDPPLPGHPGRVTWGAWVQVQGRPVLATGGADKDKTVRLWDPIARAPLGPPLRGHSDGVGWGAWAQVEDRPVLATGDVDGTVLMWDPITYAALGKPVTMHHEGPIWWGAWAQVEGRPILATGARDSTVRLWDPTANVPLRPPLTGHAGTVWWGAWARLGDRPVLATGGSDRTVRLWDPIAHVPLGTPLTGHAGRVKWGTWAQVEGRPILATGGDDGEVRLWEVLYERRVARLPRYRSDDVADQDQLDRTVEAEALADLITSRSVVPPLAVGLFGDWGEGKSHFLRLLSDQVRASADRHDGLAHDAVRQVRFNAWHYAETDLWASLVAEIFNQLAVPLDRIEKSDIGLQQRQQSRLTAELLAERKISERLAAARNRRDQLRTVTSSKSRWRSLSSRHQSELRDAARGVDPGLADQVGSLYAAATGNVTWLRVKLIEGRRLMRALPWWGWLAILLVVAATVTLSVSVLPWLAKLAAGTRFGALVALSCAVAAAYRKALAGLQGRLHQTLIAVGRVKDAQRRDVETAVTVAEAEVAALQRQLQDLTPAGALAGLAADRAADDSYRRNLGLMTHIREDFQRMAKLLISVGDSSTLQDSSHSVDAVGDKMPRIDRIVLYIDDLDRCPPSRVVDVLEAVHLLLAVRLFVVVVAVDPRWLLRAVAAHHQALLHPASALGHDSVPADVGPDVDTDDEELWASTPTQYLEKIFQIVLTLPPLTTTGYNSMLDGLVDIRRDEKRDDSASAFITDISRTAEPSSEYQLIDGASDDGDEAWNTATELPAARVVERVDPLELRADERRLIQILGPPLINTPRAVKRLVNSYGLLAAIRRHRASGQSGFGADPAIDEHGEHLLNRPAMVLLAALIGFPQLGPALFTHLYRTASARPTSTWTEFLTDLAPTPIPGSWRNLAAPRLTAVQAQHWRALLAALEQVIHRAAQSGVPLPEPLTAWADWVISVGRLSFPTGRVVSELERYVSPGRST